MIGRRMGRAWLAVVLTLFSLLAFAPAASASGPGEPSLITFLQPTGPVRKDRQFTVVIRLTTVPGTPIAGVGIQLSLNGDNPRQGQTDENGMASYLIHSLSPGVYRLTAIFNGTPGHQPVEITQGLDVAGTGESHLTLDPLGPIPLGKSASITAHLADGAGSPMAGEALDLSVNGQAQATATTDETGTASLPLPRGLGSGSYAVVVTFKGSQLDAPASATMEIEIRPLEIEVQTVPALSGVRFTANGQTFVSDKDGRARLAVTAPGVYHIDLLPYTSNQNDMRISFARWSDNVFTSYHDVTIPSDGVPLEVGFNISYRAGWSFVDLESHRVDPKRVTDITIKGSDGATYTYPSDQMQWLPALRVENRLTGLEESPLQYSVMGVTINGTNVVSQMQQRFYVHPNDIWQIQLLLFTAHFESRDMIFGFPIGSSLRLQFPDNSVQIIPLDSHGQANVVSLARGLYKVNVQTVPGISPQAPLQMSRDQDVVLLIISYLDIGLGLLTALFLGPGLLLIGQPRLRRWLWNGMTVALPRRYAAARAGVGIPNQRRGRVEESDRS